MHCWINSGSHQSRMDRGSTRMSNEGEMREELQWEDGRVTQPGEETGIRIVPITDDTQAHQPLLSSAEALHRTLRPNLPPDYQACMHRMFAEGAEMAILVVDCAIRSLAVYRCHHTTFHGLRFYIDDLVTDENARGRGYGSILLRWCEERARERHCNSFDLESGAQRSRAHQFYFREGLTILAFSFSKTLKP